jgi:hypothetical protein
MRPIFALIVLSPGADGEPFGALQALLASPSVSSAPTSRARRNWQGQRSLSDGLRVRLPTYPQSDEPDRVRLRCRACPCGSELRVHRCGERGSARASDGKRACVSAFERAAPAAPPARAGRGCGLPTHTGRASLARRGDSAWIRTRLSRSRLRGRSRPRLRKESSRSVPRSDETACTGTRLSGPSGPPRTDPFSSVVAGSIRRECCGLSSLRRARAARGAKSTSSRCRPSARRRGAMARPSRFYPAPAATPSRSTGRASAT